MNTDRKLFHALLASFAIVAIPVQAAESTTTTLAAADPDLVALCAATKDGMVPKPHVERALHRMLDMGETPEAVKMAKADRRKMQFDIFWKDVTKPSGG